MTQNAKTCPKRREKIEKKAQNFQKNFLEALEFWKTEWKTSFGSSGGCRNETSNPELTTVRPLTNFPAEFFSGHRAAAPEALDGPRAAARGGPKKILLGKCCEIFSLLIQDCWFHFCNPQSCQKKPSSLFFKFRALPDFFSESFVLFLIFSSHGGHIFAICVISTPQICLLVDVEKQIATILAILA